MTYKFIMNKILNFVLVTIILTLTVFVSSGCTNNSVRNLKLNALYVYKSNKLEIQIELYNDHTMSYKYIPNSYNAPEYYKGTFSIDGNTLTMNLISDGENSENTIIKNGNELTYTIISDTVIKDDHGRKIKYKDAIEKITTATVIITSNISNDNTVITKQDIGQDNKLIKTYEELMNSKTIKKDVEEKYGVVNNVELKCIEDTDMIKVTYVCDEHNNEECKQILKELLSKFSEELKEIYNINNVYIVDEPEISSRVR